MHVFVDHAVLVHDEELNQVAKSAERKERKKDAEPNHLETENENINNEGTRRKKKERKKDH